MSVKKCLECGKSFTPARRASTIACPPCFKKCIDKINKDIKNKVKCECSDCGRFFIPAKFRSRISCPSCFKKCIDKINRNIENETKRICHERGYEFVLNLQNDFPSIRPVPFDGIFEFLDQNSDTGFVQLNNKKWLLYEKRNGKFHRKRSRRTRNKYSGEKLKFKKGAIYGNTKIIKSNHHISFNPNIIRASLIHHLVRKVVKKREGQIMERYHKLNMYASTVRKRCFETVIRKRQRKWRH